MSMRVTDEQFRELAARYEDGTATAEERALFEEAYRLLSHRYTEWSTAEMGSEAAAGDRIRTTLLANLHRQQRRRRRRMVARYALASVLLLSAGAAFLHYHRSTPDTPQITAAQDVAPAHQQAVLTLADGRRVVLTHELTGQLAQQGNTDISINREHIISYHANADGTEAAMLYNTLSTARGEQSPFPLILADGTKVWLNAASSLTFPAAFTGKERLVKLTGEACFEVTRQAAAPFRIQVNGQVVEDMGTAFNIKAYTEEPVMTTTLFAGSARVKSGTQSAVLLPGQQAGSTPAHIQVSDHVNTSLASAWREGYFRFNQAPLPEIMRELSRWYNLTITYKGDYSTQLFNMKISRNTTLTRALKILELGGISYRLNGHHLEIAVP